MVDIIASDKGPIHIYDGSKGEFAPTLEIVAVKSWVAGRCYYKTEHRIRSTIKLSDRDLNGWVRKLIEYGQDYSVSKIDQKPAGYYTTTKDQSEGHFPVAFYQYCIITGIDSSD